MNTRKNSWRPCPASAPARKADVDGLKELIKAIDFAAGKHRDQRRKDVEATPYINHPIDLASLLVEEAGVTDVTVIIAAILHDTLEDTETTLEELETVFGPEVARIVMEVSDDKTLPKGVRKRLQVTHATNNSREAKLVKLADKICNLRDMVEHPPAHWPLERKQEYYDWAKEVIDQMRGTNEGLEALFDIEYQKKP